MLDAGSTQPNPSDTQLGIVVIGRNEGERLVQCLRSVRGADHRVVYIDSGSTDDSVLAAELLAVRVESLDMTRPFTAARARNVGWQRLLKAHPGLEFVQFVDGDCEVDAGWIDTARAFLRQRPDVAAVCGRRRERYPQRSIYNLLCDIEWNTPSGETQACGGDVLMRVSALTRVNGFRDDLIAGEEPELCVRLRAEGWKIWRLDAEMTLHDAAMTRIGQWSKRCMRAGFAYAEGMRLHGAPPELHWVRETRSALAWGVVIPVAIALAALLAGPLALWGLAIYPLQMLRIGLRLGGDAKARRARAFFLVAGKFPESAGVLRAWLSHLRRRQATLIEYK